MMAGIVMMSVVALGAVISAVCAIISSKRRELDES